MQGRRTTRSIDIRWVTVLLNCSHGKTGIMITRLRSIIRPHRPPHNSTTKQVDHCRQNQPGFFGHDTAQLANSRLIGRSYSERATKHVRRDRKTVLAVDRDNAEAPLAASSNAVLLYQPLYPQFADRNALRLPDARPVIRPDFPRRRR